MSSATVTVINRSVSVAVGDDTPTVITEFVTGPQGPPGPPGASDEAFESRIAALETGKEDIGAGADPLAYYIIAKG